MNEIDIFKEKAKNGYTFCFADNCPLKERCLPFRRRYTSISAKQDGTVTSFSTVSSRIMSGKEGLFSTLRNANVCHKNLSKWYTN